MTFSIFQNKKKSLGNRRLWPVKRFMVSNFLIARG